MKHSLRLAFFLLWSILLAGCRLTRHVPENDYLYDGNRFSTTDSIDTGVLRDAEKKVLAKQNARFIGIPYKLIIYNTLHKPGKTKDGWLQKLGEPPVLLSQIDTLAMMMRLRQQLFAAGYFKSELHAAPEKTEKKAQIHYTIRPGKRYRLGQVVYPPDSAGILHEIRAAADSSLLKPGDFLRLDVLARERERINEHLKNEGYFLFNPEQLAFRADTLDGYRNDLHLFLKNTSAPNTLKTWKIGRIVVHNNDPVTGDSTSHGIRLGEKSDTKNALPKAAGYRSALYRNALLLKEGDLYSKQKHYLSIQRLLNLETFQFVKFSFTQHPGDSANLLTTHLYVTPTKRYRMKFEVSAGAKGNNYLGSKLSSSLLNSNVFGGAEKLQLQIQGGGDVQFGGNRLGANSFNFGGNLSLALPRLLPRFHIDGGLNPTLPETKISISTNYIKVPKLFSVVLTGLSLDYLFRSNRKAEHNLTPLDVGTFKLRSASPLFDSALVLVPTLRQTFRSQLLVGSAYRLWVNAPFAPGYWFQGGGGIKVKASGNLLGLVLQNKPGPDGGKQLAGLPIAQFIKMEGELRGYVKANASNTLALRTLLGVGVAYGNSSSLPYTEQFFIGGSNSLRAFRAGTLGPGSYHSTEKVLSNIEYGDFKIEMNAEWRHSVSSTVKLATFVEAGNVWLRRKDPAKPGADLSYFLSELAVGTGLGLRLDFSLLVLRFDLGIPLRKPWYEKGNRWVIDEFALTSRTWRRQNLVLNIGVGYPF
ncbi:translocation and assembly module lipoprotein TamL [Dyadobacter jiangsuensis]|uniref:Outer membrane protein assembly factor BamA n=1 Tax=Dyadobacter jiangsuensis TaxID=1591085 RepID=A0A2P8FQ44_9BACT|nr:BamA/TamA family outer membrane protein [Dyadobacter jiangsuensis]PSL23850.1 outer membrane protein assembly factor BamA [Dyadobacter jiangsuensis]